MSKDVVNLIAQISHKECDEKYQDAMCLLEQYREEVDTGIGEFIEEEKCLSCKKQFIDRYLKICFHCRKMYCHMKYKCQVHDIKHSCMTKFMDCIQDCTGLHNGPHARRYVDKWMCYECYTCIGNLPVCELCTEGWGHTVYCTRLNEN